MNRYMGLKIAAVLAIAGAGAGCGGSVDMSCDEVRSYQLAKEHRRLESPEGLDELDPLKEMPLPEPSPRAPRPDGSPCLDRPPAISLGSGEEADEDARGETDEEEAGSDE